MKVRGYVQQDDEHCFGAPRVQGVRVAVIVERFLGGDSLADIGADYDIPPDHIESAMRYWITRFRKKPLGMAE